MEKQELVELGISNRQQLRNAIMRGDRDAALAKIDEIAGCEAKFRNVLLGWIDLLLTKSADRLGEEFVYETMKDLFERDLKPFMGAEAGEPDVAARLKKRAYIWTGMHDSNISIEEDDEKFTLTIMCDSGGWVRSQERCGKTKRAYAWSNSDPGMAYYCAHCTVSYEIKFTEEYGYPNFIVLPPRKAGEPCVQYMYKNARAIPTKYLEMFQTRVE